MHSRIFQITKDKNEKKLKLSDFNNSCYEWFKATVCDYIRNDDFNDSLNWLIKSLEECSKAIVFNKSDNSIIFKNGFRELYFKDNFKVFKEISTRMKLEDFSWTSQSGVLDLIIMNLAIEDKFGFYVVNDYEIKTFDNFVREDIVYDVKYYIIESFDYHG